MRKPHQNIFILALALSLFLDAINIDDLVMARGMVHEEYEGQSTEYQPIDAFPATFTQAAGLTMTFRGASKASSVLRFGQWIDEDSPSLAAPATLTEDIIGILIQNSKPQRIVPYSPTFEFSIICKLQL